MNCVDFVGVGKRFSGNEVFSELSAQCPKGQTTAIVGESGSGKTTLLQLVNGLLLPDAGEIRVFGEPIPRDELERFRRGIGYAVQGAGLFPHMTAKANVTLIARLEGWDPARIDTRYEQLLVEMDLPLDVGDRYPRQLSGGQQQRLGLCRAFMLEPELLLLDEPFSAVDPITRTGIYERFELVKEREGVSSLLVTHDLREARRLAEYLIILQGGKIQQQGPTRKVLAEPETSYVSSLIESQLS